MLFVKYKFCKAMDQLFTWPTTLYAKVPNTKTPIRYWIFVMCMRQSLRWGYRAYKLGDKDIVT